VTVTQIHSRARLPSGLVVCAVGDVHGRLDLLEPALEELFRLRSEALAAGKSFAAVLLGDYIDRGPDSCAVLDRLASLSGSEQGQGFVFLRGNHEQALLDIVDGRARADRWLEFGGVETLNAYVRHSGGRLAVEPDADLADQLLELIPEAHLRFLRRTQMFVIYGNYAFAHAGLSADGRLEEQTVEDMLWRRATDDGLPRHGLTVVHGHSIHQAPAVGRWRIGIDTGAYATGQLTILRLEDDRRAMLCVRRAGPAGDVSVAPWEAVDGLEVPTTAEGRAKPVVGALRAAAHRSDRRAPRAALLGLAVMVALGVMSLLVLRDAPFVRTGAATRSSPSNTTAIRLNTL
jgi:serine/threonine protein phosphatase 1